MITIDSFADLCATYAKQDAEGWIFVPDKASFSNADALLASSFIIADDEDEEDELIDQHPTLLEIPIFKGVMETEQEAGRSSVRDYAEGCIYYMEQDTFRE